MNEHRTEKLSEIVARQILDRLVEDDVKPGTMLPAQAAMEEQYGVGRASLREALRILEVHGVIRVKPGPGGGPMVADTGAADFARSASLHFKLAHTTLNDVIEARLAMEPLMARLAAERCTEKEAEILTATIEADFDAVNDGSSGSWAQRSQAYHVLIGEIAQNSALQLFSTSLAVIQNHRIRSVYPVGDRQSIVDVHRRIGEAVIEGDGMRAEYLMRRHIEALRERIGDLYPAMLDEIVEWDQR